MLWDIDLTLVELRGVGRSWYRHAIAAVLGRELSHFPAFQGRTERAITLEMLATHGAEGTDELVERMYAALVDVATRDQELLAGQGRALPGAVDALAALATRPDVVQSLVTGNLPEVSRVKLAAFGMDPHVDFEIGGYGSLSASRPDLVPAAVGLASAKHDVRFEPRSVVVIGDTPHDVEAALKHGATAIGVATGHSTEAELHAAGAHVVLTDLSDTATVLDSILRAA
ncbi:HAD hydrolase-like protein [Solihabitans fulvus]|uniref:HAD hydrolase-like protein n=1 Tax=Solihabitans fulvus TaxID=1892852 RepID=A0A5B2X6K8_9PSEU|nr:HAD hydrolase-like protein [Solihabitans fulvus]